MANVVDPYFIGIEGGQNGHHQKRKEEEHGEEELEGFSGSFVF
jgi:hypothetical protein